jgi:hypothetical protein
MREKVTPAGWSGFVLVRDSKDREGPRLALSDQAWSAFVEGIKQGEFGI